MLFQSHTRQANVKDTDTFSVILYHKHQFSKSFNMKELYSPILFHFPVR